MTNKLAKTVMRNISSQNLKARNSSSRRNIGKRVNIETNKPYSKAENTRNLREARDANERYDKQKTILLSNYSSLGNSNPKVNKSSSSSRKPSQRKVKDLASLAKEIKGEDTRSGGKTEKETRKVTRPNNRRMTLGELSQSKGAKAKNTVTSKGKERSFKRSSGGNKNLSLDSLADSIKKNN